MRGCCCLASFSFWKVPKNCQQPIERTSEAEQRPRGSHQSRESPIFGWIRTIQGREKGYDNNNNNHDDNNNNHDDNNNNISKRTTTRPQEQQKQLQRQQQQCQRLRRHLRYRQQRHRHRSYRHPRLRRLLKL